VFLASPPVGAGGQQKDVAHPTKKLRRQKFLRSKNFCRRNLMALSFQLVVINRSEAQAFITSFSNSSVVEYGKGDTW